MHVVYGQPALKTHAKCVLVVRREGDGVRNYVHIGTGNYHSATARLYTDFGLFTTDEQIGADVADMFNYLTGYGRPLHYRKVLMAPEHLRDGIVEEIERTIAAHSEESPAQDRHEDERARRRALHPRPLRRLPGRRARGPERPWHLLPATGAARASPRTSAWSRSSGACSSTARVYAFERGGEHTVYIASADLMPRNLDHRVELAVPIESEELRAELLDTLERGFADNQNAWDLDSDGIWHRLAVDSDPTHPQPRSLQLELAELYAARAGGERAGGERAAGEHERTTGISQSGTGPTAALATPGH